MSKIKQKKEKMIRRRKRTRAKIRGTSSRPRLSVFRSLRHIWAQLIDDESGKTLAAASDLEIINKTSAPEFKSRKVGPKGLVVKNKEVLTPRQIVSAGKVGELLAQKAQEKKISLVVFDKGPYKYHGLVQALSEGARKGGLRF